MTDLLWTLLSIFLVGILVALFKPRWLEKVLIRTLLKLMAIVTIVIALLFWFTR